ncbi:inositol polyphosphate 5-phosphatase K-like protein, partial [Dinothrombium tinctorium]
MGCSMLKLCCFLFVFADFRCFLAKTDSAFSVKVLTWNINEKKPIKNMKDLLNLEASSNRPTIYAIGFQEVNPILSSSDTNENLWTISLINTFEKYDYELLAKKSIHGSFVIIFIAKSESSNVQLVEGRSVRTGFFGIFGNKGGNAIRFNFKGTSLCFVGAHFHAGDEELKKRIVDYREINNKVVFDNPDTKRIINHDLVFWFGDLNFRI